MVLEKKDIIHLFDFWKSNVVGHKTGVGIKRPVLGTNQLVDFAGVLCLHWALSFLICKLGIIIPDTIRIKQDEIQMCKMWKSLSV